MDMSDKIMIVIVTLGLLLMLGSVFIEWLNLQYFGGNLVAIGIGYVFGRK